MGILKEIKTIPLDFFNRCIQNSIKFSDSSIKNVFFSKDCIQQFSVYNSDKNMQYFKELSNKYVSFVISKCTNKDFNKTIQNVDYEIIYQWFEENGNRLGENLFVDYMLYEKQLRKFQANAKEVIESMVTNGMNDSFVNGFLVECDTAGTNIPAKAFLIFLNVLDPSGNSVNKILPVWKKNVRWKVIADFQQVHWLESVNFYFKQDSNNFSEIKSSVDNCINSKTGPYSYTSREVIDCGPTGAPIVGNVTRYRYEYGEDVLNWLNSNDGPKKYNLRSNSNPDNFQQASSPSSGCVLINTSILLADRTFKPVQSIQEGDKVLNGNNTVSICSGELIYNPYVTMLYSVNDDKPFMSLEHAVMTDRGWCSLNPQLTRQINSYIDVKTLEIGDNIWIFNSDGDIDGLFKRIKIEKINITEAENEYFIGYDLHFREGYNSYIANNYLCLLNYPEITIKNILSNIHKKMSYSERIQFVDLVNDYEELFSKAFGKEAVNMLQLSMENIEI